MRGSLLHEENLMRM